MNVQDRPAFERTYNRLVAIADQKDETRDGASKSLSLRLGITAHMQLERLSERLRDNKHALAVELLRAAVQDVYDRLELPALTADEVEEWMLSNFKGMVRRIPEDATATEKAMMLEEAAEEARRVNWDEVKS